MGVIITSENGRGFVPPLLFFSSDGRGSPFRMYICRRGTRALEPIEGSKYYINGPCQSWEWEPMGVRYFLT